MESKKAVHNLIISSLNIYFRNIEVEQSPKALTFLHVIVALTSMLTASFATSLQKMVIFSKILNNE